MEESYQILQYLPNRFKQRDEQEYIEFLWEAFESNYQNEKYQFAFIAYHMLFMSFVYFTIWQIKSVESIAPVHQKQVLTYLKLTGLKLGLLINFNEALIKNGITRIVNNL
ncbi:MAG: GxxExxY protein [Bacteroidota bacterium]|nr:GxxExxY protein [Bacteroidota bacterium]